MRMEWVAPYVVDDSDAEEHRRYRLTLQKQPGTVADGVAIRIVAPEGSRIVSAADGLTVSSTGDAAEVSTNLRTRPEDLGGARPRLTADGA